MSVPTLTKQFIIEIDVINGTVDYSNPENLTYFEVVGMIEYAKMMIVKEFLEDTRDWKAVSEWNQQEQSQRD